MISLINNDFRNIARGQDALLILGGPSVDEYDQKKLDKLKEKFFTVTANMVIKKHCNVDLYFTADNVIVKQMFEKYPYVSLAHQEMGILDTKEVLNAVIGGMVIKPTNEYMFSDMIKVIVCQNLFPLNNVFMTGQLYLDFLERYSQEYDNVYGMLEHREISQNEIKKSIFGYEGKLITDDSFTEREYGNLIENTEFGESLKIYSGGNVSSDILQLLWFMGFSQVIVIGYGDIGQSSGYDDNRIFEWTQSEMDSLLVHKKMWGDRIKVLNGGELMKKHGEFENISYEELVDKKQNKQKLIDKIKEL